jgi:hypothetical protein
VSSSYRVEEQVEQERGMKQAASTAYFWTLKMDATYFFETPIDFQRTTLRYVELSYFPFFLK